MRNTLFDENASCHLAIGRAYPICLEGGATMSPEELAAQGANTSLAHVDFMIGSDKLDIDGETASGELVPVFRAVGCGSVREETASARWARTLARWERTPSAPGGVRFARTSARASAAAWKMTPT